MGLLCRVLPATATFYGQRAYECLNHVALFGLRNLRQVIKDPCFASAMIGPGPFSMIVYTYGLRRLGARPSVGS